MKVAVDSLWPRRRGLFGKYVASFVGLVVFVLAINAAGEMWYSYQATKTALARALSDKAETAASRVEQFFAELERQVNWATRASAVTLDQHRNDYASLLQQLPAVDQLLYLDGDGREQLKVSRETTVYGGGADHGRDTLFHAAGLERISLGAVEFRGHSEPTMKIAMAHSGRNTGVTVAEINLRFLSDIVRAIPLNTGGRAYVVGADGRLLAHSDKSADLSLDVSSLPQVAAARDPAAAPVAIGRDPGGGSVLVGSAPAAKINWSVLVEQPMSEAFRPLYDLLQRILWLLVLGLIVAILAGIVQARRMLGPIRALQAGAARLGAGDFSQRIEVRTGDEIEELADKFNLMAGQLYESYSRLEQKVEERTRDLRLANAHKSQFFANMSHELRTPLNAVLGYSELLVDGLYGNLPDRARQVLERIQINGRHLLGLINDVLDFSKIEAGQLTLGLEEYSMRSLVESVVASTESLAQAKGLALKAVVADGLPTGRGDDRRLRQVLLNIVGNAIKFSAAGVVEIRARAVNGHFELAIHDSGPGIAPEDQTRIFEEFQQVDSSSTRQQGGTGLGLAISKRLIALHGGSISVESALGAGATFHIVLPVRSGEEKVQA